MTAPSKWKVVCLVMIVANILAVYLLFRARQDYSVAEEILVADTSGRAIRDADDNFKAGALRLFRLEVPASGDSHFTGQMDGSFEIWTWPRTPDPSQSPRLQLAMWTKYVDTYNDRMRIRRARADLIATQTSVTLTSPPSQRP